MSLFRSLISFGVLMSLAACATAAPLPEIEVGQVWTVKDASTSSMRLTIEKIEPYASDTVVHVSIKGADVTTHSGGSEVAVNPGVIGHIPFEKTILLRSIDELEQTGADGSAFFEQGYSHWKNNKGGIFSIPVSQAVEMSLSITQQSTDEEN
ncbi:MAG: hypothetical protein RLO80_10910 [Hyphomonas sp.]